jgi:hypothetical protein
MAKRFFDTDLWNKDFFITMPIQYQLFFFYAISKCDHAGLWTPNYKIFEVISSVNIDAQKAIDFFNIGKERVRILPSGKWFFVNFFVFQYGKRLNTANRVHQSIAALYEAEGVSLESFGLDDYSLSLRGPQNGVNLTSKRPQLGDMEGVKEKDKDKDTEIEALKSVKKRYAEKVTMTEDEYSKLVHSHGPFYTEKAIFVLDNYKGANGKTYDSDYKAILSWAMDKVKKEFPMSANRETETEKITRVNREGLKKFQEITSGIFK